MYIGTPIYALLYTIYCTLAPDFRRGGWMMTEGWNPSANRYGTPARTLLYIYTALMDIATAFGLLL